VGHEPAAPPYAWPVLARGSVRLARVARAVGAVGAVAALGLSAAGCGGRYPDAGGVLFDQACGQCHTLSGRTDRFHQGGDLQHFHSTRVQLLQLTAEMPVRRPLTRGELETIVTYLRTIEARHPGP
jgi:mono/diheme cytochrome c family protein